MKKIILTLLIGGFIMAGASAKTAVVYFSATGTTEKMAKAGDIKNYVEGLLK